MEVGAQREVQRLTGGSRELTWLSRHNRGVGMLFLCRARHREEGRRVWRQISEANSLSVSDPRPFHRWGFSGGAESGSGTLGFEGESQLSR